MNKIIQRIAASPGFYQYDNPDNIAYIRAKINEELDALFFTKCHLTTRLDYRDYPNLHGKTGNECYCGAIGIIQKSDNNEIQFYAELFVKYTNQQDAINNNVQYCIGIIIIDIDTLEIIFADAWPQEEININLAQSIIQQEANSLGTAIIDYYFT